LPARNIRAPRDTVLLGARAREHIQAHVLIKRLQNYVHIDPDNPKPGDIRLTRTQAFIALALLKKVLPDLASVEVSGNPDKPLMVQVVRFSDGEQLEAPRPVIDVTAIEMEKAEAEAEAEIAIEAATGKKAGRGRKSGAEWLGARQRKVAEATRKNGRTD
jgi:hypothetical protein